MHQSIVQWLAAMIFVAFSATAVAGEIYKCKNDQGRLLYQKTPCAATAETVTSWTPAIKTTSGQQSVNTETAASAMPLALKQHDSGHYFVDGAINGKPLVFVVDTGASVVSLPDADAAAAGITCKDSAMMETANGITEACTAVIPELRFGHFVVKNADSMIVKNLGQPLLGMNVLQQFKIAQDRGEMVISAQHLP